MAENGDLVKLIGQLLDEKLRPMSGKLDRIETMVSGLQGSIKRINARLATVEALLEPPSGSTH